MKPKMMTLRKFIDLDRIKTFNSHHKTNLENWDEVLTSGKWKDSEMYEDYKRWYISQFTKLGKALK